MLPLSILRTAVGHPMLVELKNGETYNGNLVSCDTYMNITLRKVICTSRDGDSFWRIPQCYIRGNTIKYMCIPDEIIDMVPPEDEKPASSLAVLPPHPSSAAAAPAAAPAFHQGRQQQQHEQYRSQPIPEMSKEPVVGEVPTQQKKGGKLRITGPGHGGRGNKPFK